MEGKPSCASCRFFKPVRESRGECRRRAPVPLKTVNNSTGETTGWPFVSQEHWCGEHEGSLKAAETTFFDFLRRGFDAK